MKTKKKFIFELDKDTEKKLEKVAKEFGTTKAGCIRLLIRDEYRFFIEQRIIKED